MSTVNMRAVLTGTLLAAAVALTACTQSDLGYQGELRSVTSVPASGVVTGEVKAPDSQLENDKDMVSSMARQGAMGQSVKDTLAGPGLLLSLGPVVNELRLTPSGVLPDTTFTWAGCPNSCPQLDTRTVLMTLAADLSASGTTLSRDRIAGPQSSESDPRPSALRDLPSLTAYREDTAEQRWRSWHVSFDPNSGGVLAVIAESGPLKS